MTPSKLAKELGCSGLAQVAKSTRQSERTLINWFNNPKKRRLFEITCKGVAGEQESISQLETKANAELEYLNDYQTTKR